jgi:hypothetical protein
MPDEDVADLRAFLEDWDPAEALEAAGPAE